MFVFCCFDPPANKNKSATCVCCVVCGVRVMWLLCALCFVLNWFIFLLFIAVFFFSTRGPLRASARALLGRLVSYFISMQESRMAFFDLYIGILVTSFDDPATDLISNLLRTFFRVSATHLFWGFRMDKYKPFDEEGARAQRKPHT